jgi:hypothetical protein
MALPPDTISKLNDHFGQYVICVSCGQCRHFFEVKPEALARRHGWRASFTEATANIACTKCNSTVCRIEVAFEKRPRGWSKNPS